MLTAPTKRTEARQIKPAQFPSDMPLGAPRPQRTEAPRIMLTGRSSRLSVNVEVVTVVAAAAVASRIVRALWSSADVVFVEEVAGVAFFAQPFQPVLAY